MGKIVDWFKEGFEVESYHCNGGVTYRHGGRALLLFFIIFVIFVILCNL